MFCKDISYIQQLCYFFSQGSTLCTTGKYGKIIIRDADKDLKGRHYGTKLTELLSTNIGFNKTNFKLEYVSHSMIEKIANKHGLTLEIIDNTKHTSNLIYVLS